MSLDIYTWHWTLTLVVLAGTLLKQKVLGSFSPVVTFTILGNVKLQREIGRERARERARERESPIHQIDSPNPQEWFWGFVFTLKCHGSICYS